MSPGLPRVVHGDPGRLRQVLLNLLGNAVKFTERGGVEVDVNTFADESGSRRLEVVVRDSGPGIAPAALERLFTAFGQADATVGRVHGGSGLGLMIARRFAEAMGGTLRVDGPEKGGARFVLDLPLNAVLDPAASTVLSGLEVSLAGATLLVVDPLARTRDLVRGLAASWGMTARAAERGREALLLLRDAADRGAAYDFVVCDRELPDMAGDEVAKAVREDRAMAHAGIVMLVASGIRGDAMKASAAGFDAYLPKPVQAATLLDCLRRLRRPGRGASLITSHSLSEAQQGPLRILLVDDNPVNVKLARIMLERAGHQVAAAADGAAALAAVVEAEHDLVLMDVQMPVMDGFEATRRIRALSDPRRSRTPIVAVTANALQGDADRCLGEGMDGYVGKPFDRAALLGAIERWGRRAA